MHRYVRVVIVAFMFLVLAVGFIRTGTDDVIGSEPEGNAATPVKIDRPICEGWPKPDFVFFITGRQHGYIEPCGCTGLSSQKGGLARRQTLYRQIKEKGWDVVPIDVGNQVRRLGPQATIKFQTTMSALKSMDYKAVALGPDDLKLDTGELLSEVVEDTPLVCANLSILDMPVSDGRKIVETGKHRIGITAVVGSKEHRGIQNGDFLFSDPVESIEEVSDFFDKENCNVRVLLSHASTEETKKIVLASKKTQGYRIVITAGGADEPALNPQRIEGTRSYMIQTGKKGMYVGVLGVFADTDTPIRYERVALDSRFEDSTEMLQSLKVYQDRLKDSYTRDWNELGLRAVVHPSGHEFVGSETCMDCHEHAFDVWESSRHHHATHSIAFPNERSSIPRNFDPECLSCHVTGWNPQDYYPYASGYTDFDKSKHLHGNGCENCHGPGGSHVAAENGDVDLTEQQIETLRKQMVLPLAKAEQHCIQCHDLDNDPNFKEDGAFERYWEQIKHYEDE